MPQSHYRPGARAASGSACAKLGAHAFTAPSLQGQRTAACIGKGVAKKAGQRQARALQEAIQAGMARAKGGKKKRQQAAAPAGGRPKSAGGEGLQELGGTFRNGVLKMKSPQRK